MNSFVEKSRKCLNNRPLPFQLLSPVALFRWSPISLCLVVKKEGNASTEVSKSTMDEVLRAIFEKVRCTQYLLCGQPNLIGCSWVQDVRNHFLRADIWSNNNGGRSLTPHQKDPRLWYFVCDTLSVILCLGKFVCLSVILPLWLFVFPFVILCLWYIRCDRFCKSIWCPLRIYQVIALSFVLIVSFITNSYSRYHRASLVLNANNIFSYFLPHCVIELLTVG